MERILIPACATLLSVFALLACHKTEKGEFAALPLYTVGVEKPQVRTPTPPREWLGQLAALANAPIMPQRSGCIGGCLSDNRQMVHKGQLLCKIGDTRYTQALIHAPNDKNALRPGMYVKVRANVGEEKDALTVPVGAVCSLQEQPYLIIINSNYKAELRAVATGLEENGRVAVLQGLSADDLVVVRGTQQAMRAAENRARLQVESAGN